MFEKHSSPSHNSWKKLVSKYQNSDTAKSTWQFINSFVPFLILWYMMYLSLGIGYWLTLIVAVPAAGFLMRMFIIQHDCGHGSFFKSRKVNDLWGMVCSIFTLTPYHYWKKNHSIHHANAGKLEERGVGDVYTMTVDEYLNHSGWKKFKYRIRRNPVVLFLIVPAILFMIVYRFPTSKSASLKPYYTSVYLTTLTIGILVTGIIFIIGWKAFLMIQIPISVILSSTGMWFFYVQHQFEDAYWNRCEQWNFKDAAIKGSSYYKLPKIFQWFSGNIGFHHIHHLSPRIPNYKLEKCHEENPEFHNANVLTIRSSLKSMFLNLWDEKQRKLVSFYHLKTYKKESGLL